MNDSIKLKYKSEDLKEKMQEKKLQLEKMKKIFMENGYNFLASMINKDIHICNKIIKSENINEGLYDYFSNTCDYWINYLDNLPTNSEHLKK